MKWAAQIKREYSVPGDDISKQLSDAMKQVLLRLDVLEARPAHESRADKGFRSDVKVIIIGLFALAALTYLVYLGFQLWSEPGLLAILKEHAVATIGLPLAAITSLFLVLFFEYTTGGNVKVKALGFEFEGPSGPVILWVICFLAQAIALQLVLKI